MAGTQISPPRDELMKALRLRNCLSGSSSESSIDTR